MTFEIDHHINELVQTVRDNDPIMKELTDNPSNLSIEDLIVLRENLRTMEANIALLKKASDVEKKSKRRMNPFKK